MNRSVAEASRILEVDGRHVKTWAWAYKDYLSGVANPGKGKPRTFTDSDVLALMYICHQSELNEPADEIRAGLDREDHYTNDHYRDVLYAHTPILQELPDDLDETWRHGILLVGGGVDGYLALARNYRVCAEAMLEAALISGEPRGWGFPVLFSYRHTLELYLKIIGEIDDHTHSLRDCVRLVEKRHGERLPSRAREWIIELDEIDPDGTTFRYADEGAGKSLRNVECWVDFVQFKSAMTSVFSMLDMAILKAVGDGKIEGDGFK
jgi:hypothetical protein